MLIQVELSKSELEKLQKQNQSVQLDVTQVREGVVEGVVGLKMDVSLSIGPTKD